MYAPTASFRAPGYAVGFIALFGSFGASVAVLRWNLAGLFVVAALAPAAIAAAVDLRCDRVPDRLVGLSFVPTAFVTAHQIAAGAAAAVLLAVIVGAAAIAIPLLVMHLVSPEAMGFGDVKIGAALGAAVGLVEPRAGLVALCLASAITGTVGLVMRRRALPFGPGLFVGSVGALAIAGRLGAEPLPWR